MGDDHFLVNQLINFYEFQNHHNNLQSLFIKLFIQKLKLKFHFNQSDYY